MKKVVGFLALTMAGRIFAGGLEFTVRPPVEGEKVNARLDALRMSIREARTKNPGQPVVIRLKEGVYPLSAPFTLEPEDSGTPTAPVTFIGEGDGAVLSGGRPVTGWKDAGSGVWEADLPKDADGKPFYFESLFVNGRRAPRARMPNEGFFNITAVDRMIETNTVTKALREKDAVSGKAGDFASLAGISKEDCSYAQIVVHTKWVSERRPITAFDGKAQAVLSEGAPMPRHRSWAVGDPFYLENVRGAFDTSGEWFYDAKNGKVLYRPLPGERMGRVCPLIPWHHTAEVIAPAANLPNLLVLKGEPANKRFVHDIVFKNLSFAYSDSPDKSGKRGPTSFGGGQAAVIASGAVLADGAHGVTFDHCSIQHTGEYALWFRDGCMSNKVVHCAMTDLGAGGVRIGSTARQPGKEYAPAGAVPFREYGPFSTAFNTIDNCIIRHGGRFHAAGVGVLITHASDNSVTHNEISDLFYTGVSAGWVWGYGGSVAQRNTVAFNRIHQIGQAALADMGGVYTLGTSFGTCVSNNVIYDVDSYSYGGWGLYPDEGSEGIVLENNLVFGTKDASFHQHYGRDNILRNNILCCSKAGQVAVTRTEPHRSVTVERNIIYWTDGPTFSKYNGTLKETAKIDWRGNLWWKADGKFDFNGKTFAQWQQKGNDKDGLAADPRFVDPSNTDFHLLPDSPAFKIGFRPFEFSSAGVYGSDAWKKLATE